MTFTIVYRPSRPTFPADATPSEVDAISQHFEHVMSLAEALRFVGRCEDAAFGIAVFESASHDAADAFARNDPAVRTGIFTYELREFRIIYP